MSEPFIRTDGDLADYCQSLADASSIAFDTEFVSEDCYRPELCLLQVAARNRQGEQRLAVIDPLAEVDLHRFWQIIAEGQHETIVHAGRQELLFCLEAAGKAPNRLFDVQIAAGLVGGEYPSSYSSLTNKLLGTNPKGGETRTNWRRRPLSKRQIDYALDDARFLLPMSDALQQQLRERGRSAWIVQEMAAWQNGVEASVNQERWRRVSGSSNLGARELAIVRELWRWREEEAQRLNKLARRVLRDDLIVELARRRTSDEQRIQAVRGFERRDYRKLAPVLAQRIEQALRLSKEQLPRSQRREESANKRIVLGQFLASALAAVCRDLEISPGLLGGPKDVRELIAHRLGERGDKDPPCLAIGWRAEVVGDTLDDLLSGDLAIRIGDAQAEQPLRFERSKRPDEAP